VADPDFALGKMVRLWMQCIERETYAVTKPVIVALFNGATDAPEWLVSAELAEPIEGGFRIKGTRGRIEYLAEKRAKARENGTKGGRPRKPTLVSGNNRRRGVVETPPAPAPAPAPAHIEEPPIPPNLDSPRFRDAWEGWKKYRRERNGKKLTASTIKLQLKKLSEWGVDRAVASIEHTISQGWMGLYEPDGKGQNPSLSSQVTDGLSKFLARGES
jgi:hypothetical protein